MSGVRLFIFQSITSCFRFGMSGIQRGAEHICSYKNARPRRRGKVKLSHACPAGSGALPSFLVLMEVL